MPAQSILFWLRTFMVSLMFYVVKMPVRTSVAPAGSLLFFAVTACFCCRKNRMPPENRRSEAPAEGR
jgi:hypothetical protein